VRGNPAELKLVFGNLLDNAVKYSDEHVDVQIGVTHTHDGRVKVEIADRGIGIPRRELRRIFQRFYRAGRDVHRRVAGLGLGLFVARSLVRRQGGNVVARSDGAGRGSRFVVTLRSAPSSGA
jgi:signal transduction histidine kinase